MVQYNPVLTAELHLFELFQRFQGYLWKPKSKCSNSIDQNSICIHVQKQGGGTVACGVGAVTAHKYTR